MKAKKKIIILVVALLLAICLIIVGIVVLGNKKTTTTTTATSKVAAGTCSLDTTDLFSDRDLDPSYDESEAKTITLSGSEDVKITEEGIYVLSGTLNASVVVNVEDTEKVQLVLNGVTITSTNNACILVENADKVFITLKDGTTNTLKNSGSYATYDELTNIDACIFSKDDLTLNGTGTLKIDAIGHGVVSKNDLKVTGGVYEITSDEHALSGKESVLINAGTFTLNAGEKGIKSKNADETGSGLIYIGGGTFNINAGTEGIEGTKIYINGGTIEIVAKDDGINAASEFNNDTILLEISAGYLHINASGDGVDSNGAIAISGGETYISGATNDGDCAFDYQTEGSITGGILIATGMSGMAETFSDADQGAILYSVSSYTSSEVVLKDSDGNEIISWTPDKQYNSVLISTPEITDGSTYTLTIGTTSESITMDGTIYGSGNGLGGGMGGGAMGGGMMGGNKGGIDPNGNDTSSDATMPSTQDGTVPEMPNGNNQQMPSGGGQMPSGGNGTTPPNMSSSSTTTASNQT